MSVSASTAMLATVVSSLPIPGNGKNPKFHPACDTAVSIRVSLLKTHSLAFINSAPSIILTLEALLWKEACKTVGDRHARVS